MSYGETLVELGAEHDDFVVFDADLAAATQTGKFKAAYPDRFFDAGIAECNMMGLAAGVATTGHIAFASTFAMFAAGRAFEQIRNWIGYPHLNVKIGATHAGISVGEDGATHKCNEDIALMRAVPGMTEWSFPPTTWRLVPPRAAPMRPIEPLPALWSLGRAGDQRPRDV